jgi:hypothetical protein
MLLPARFMRRFWFECVRSAIAEYGINLSHIHNSDGTGFAMGQIAEAKVIIGAEINNKEAAVLEPGQCEWMTAIK